MEDSWDLLVIASIGEGVASVPFPNPHHSGVPGSTPKCNVVVDRVVSVCSTNLSDSLFHLQSSVGQCLVLWEEKFVVSSFHKNPESAGSAGRSRRGTTVKG